MPGAENNENVIESNNKMHEFIKNLTKKVDSVVTIAGEVSLINQDEIEKNKKTGPTKKLL